MSITESLTSMGFTPVKLLGEGAFGKVFHCTDASSGANVAVKVCTEAQARHGAETEAALMSALPAHPNVVGVTSFNKLPGATVMAMPLATGGDTLKFMQERACTPLAETEVRAMFTQLVAAVEHLHSNGLVHRDIKCENILLSGASRRTVVLADFGFAARYQKGERALTEAYGSLHYSSPEICNEISYEGPEVDIWSMGVVLYAWASGRLPFGGATSEEIAARIVSGNFSMHRNFSADLCDLISHMLEVEPGKRATIADIKSSAWLAPASPAAAAKSPLVPQSTSVLHISRLANVDGEHRRRNSEADVKRPSRFAMALRTMFGK